MDRGWIKSGHIQGDVLGPLPGSGMAIGLGGVIGFKRAFWPFYGLCGLFMALLYQDGHS